MIDTGNSSRVSIAWLVLVLALFAAGITYWQSRGMAERELAAQIDLRAEQARYALDKEIGRHVEVLRGLQAQFMVYPDISFRTFQQLNEVLNLEQHLSGVQAVAFTRRVAPGGLEAFEEGARRELDGDPLGYPPPLVHPRADGRDAYVVQYCEPVLRNSTGVWFDQGSEAKRREAIERARDTGEWSATARIRLAVAPGEVDGVIIFLPVYRGGAVPVTLEQRRERFIGAVLLVIRIEEMLRHAFGPGLLGELDIAVYDMLERAGPGPQDARSGLIFDSGGAAPAGSVQAGAPQLPARRGYDLDLGGGMWRMEAIALPTLVKRTQYWLAPAAASAVFLLGLLVFRFVHALERSRSRLREQARSIEQTLQSREQQIARIIDSIDAALWRVEMPGGRLSYVSAAVERITGHPPRAFYDDRRLWMDSIHPDDRAQVRAMARRVQSSGRETFHYRIVRPGGEVRWIRCEAHFVAGAQAGSGCIEGIDSDITEQRQLEESLRRSNRALRAIHDCEAAIAAVDDERQLLQRICDVAVQAGYRMAWAGVLADDGSLRIRPLGQAGEHGDYLETIGPLLEAGRLEPFPVMREAIGARRPRMVDDFEADGVPPVLREQVLRHGFKSKLVLPMVHDDAVLGVLNVYGAEPDAFDAEAVALLTDMAQSLAVALQALRDRSARRAAEEMARLRERAIEASANAIIITSAQPPDYPIEYVNSAFERMTGYTAAEMIGRSPRVMRGLDAEQPGLVELRRLLHEKCEGHAVVRNYRKDGTPYWSDIYLAPVPDEQGEVRHFVAAKYDITETREYEAELEFQSNYDVLTGLANRNLLRDRLRQAIAFAARQSRPVWVMYLNLDHFKLVNETLGFTAGDTLLTQVGARLKAAVRDTDTVARLSGDDFVLVLPERSDDMAASAAVQRLLQAVGQPLVIDGHEFVPACSVGVAVHPADGAAPDTLIRHAHIAMYRAKEAGSNSFRFYAPSMNERIVQRMQLESDLRNALERGELELHYQPQVELRSGRVIGMEALLRWRHPRLGMVSPAQFVGLAEESGLIVPIGEWVLRAACAQNREWQRAGLGGLRVGVNLSARQFRQKDLGQAIARILKETGLAPQYLDIELTESLVMADVEHAVAVLSALKALGVRVLVDDFGTGYSSLAYLKRFPIDVLKIDRSFVEDIVSDPDDAAIVRTVISLAHSLRLEVIAEGVETDAQLSFLQRHGCDQMQGYLFSRPLPPAEFRELLMRGRSLPALKDEAAPQQTLLVVDDDAHVVSSLCRLLRQDGYRILSAGSAAEAFDLLARQPAHVILCDQRMPVMEGTEFLSKVKDLYPDTIRIILSGYTDLQCVIDAINCGSVYRFFTKPWDDRQLRDNIRAAFRQYWLQHRAAGDERMPVS